VHELPPAESLGRLIPVPTYRVPVTIADQRLLTVTAKTPDEARDKARYGRYDKIGRCLRRGILVVGVPQEEDD
jgi:hypothetical protein